MSHLIPTCHAILLALVLPGCCHDAPDDGETSTTTTTDAPEPTGSCIPEDDRARPHETDWLKVVDALPFPADVATLSIGGAGFNNNFENRGDVEVYFDQDQPVITVEMRIYDFSDELTFYGDEQIVGTRERIHLWAYASPDDPGKPATMPPEYDCTKGAWKDGCKIYAYYDGQSMPVRSGADFRVRLPRSYRGLLTVITADNFNEPDYARLGDVVIDGLCGSGKITLAQGSAAIHLCDELTPAPTCSPAQIAACEAFTDAMGADAAWSPLCPCQPELFGRLDIEAVEPSAADITIDLPGTPWINLTVANGEPEQPHACAPVIENCAPDSCILTSGVYAASAEYNDPGPAAPPGGGYRVTASSARCGPVEFFASPADWCDQTSTPMIAEHGRIRVCTGCL